MTASFTVTWVKTWDDRAVCDPTCCKHGPDRCLTIGQHLRPKGKGHEIILAGNVCMDCGLDTTGQLDRVAALAAAWEEHGWNRAVGMRLYDIAKYHRTYFMQQSSVPIWFAAAWDIPAADIAAALSRGAA